jgi:hypothetical protein
VGVFQCISSDMHPIVYTHALALLNECFQLTD